MKYAVPVSTLLTAQVFAYLIAYIMVNQIEIQPTFEFSAWDYSGHIYVGMSIYTVMLILAAAMLYLQSKSSRWASIALRHLAWAGPLGILSYLSLIILLLNLIFNIRFPII